MPSKQAVDCLSAPLRLAPRNSEEKRFSTDELAQCDCERAVTMGLITHVSSRGRPSVSCRC